MPALSITKTYQDGDILTEADLDNIRTSIQTFINTTGLDSSNIQANGIAVSDIGINDDEFLEFGTGNDGAIGVSSDHLNIKNVTLDKDILFKVNDGGVTTTPLQITGATSITTISSLKLTGTADANSNLISNVLDPVGNQDADTKAARAAGIVAERVNSSVIANGGTSHGSTNNKIKIFTSNTIVGSDISYATSATNGDSFTINTAGLYAITYLDGNAGAQSGHHGVSKNSAQLTTDILSITEADRLTIESWFGDATPDIACASWVGKLAAADVIRAHTSGNADGAIAKFQIVMIGRA